MTPEVAMVGIVVGGVGLTVLGLGVLILGGRLRASRDTIEIEADAAGDDV